jgi:hypothetical protein
MGGLRRIPRLKALYGRVEADTSIGSPLWAVVPLWRARIGGLRPFMGVLRRMPRFEALYGRVEADTSIGSPLWAG